MKNVKNGRTIKINLPPAGHYPLYWKLTSSSHLYPPFHPPPPLSSILSPIPSLSLSPAPALFPPSIFTSSFHYPSPPTPCPLPSSRYTLPFIPLSSFPLSLLYLFIPPCPSFHLSFSFFLSHYPHFIHPPPFFVSHSVLPPPTVFSSVLTPQFPLSNPSPPSFLSLFSFFCRLYFSSFLVGSSLLLFPNTLLFPFFLPFFLPSNLSSSLFPSHSTDIWVSV